MTDLPRRRQYLVLGICCMSLLIVSMDNTIVNVALPSISIALHASLSGLQWTIDAYILVLASLLLLSGSLADRFGRRRTFQTGLIVFVLGSLLCSLAPSLGFLVAARMLQAVGGSMLNPVAMSIITNTFTDARDRARAIGVWGGVVGLSIALGPVIGGLLTETVGWRSIFWINIPIGAAALVMTQLFVPESRAARARRLDPVGQVLVIVALATLVDAIIAGRGDGWGSVRVVTGFLVAALAVAALLAYEPRRTDPLVDFRFFSSAPFAGATAIAVAAFASFGAFLFLNTLYLQDSRGYSALEAGLATLPMALAALVGAPLSGRIVASRGPRAPLLVAGAGMTLAALALTTLTASTPLGVLAVTYFVFGVGFGFVNAPITNSAVSGMPRSQSGVAAAIASTSRQVGQALGVAVAGSIAGTAASGTMGSSFAIATHPAWWVVAGCGAVVLAVSAASTGAWARGTTALVGDLLAEEPVRV